jgi:hypothetical protein
MAGISSDAQISEYPVKKLKLAGLTVIKPIDAENSILQIPEIDHYVA